VKNINPQYFTVNRDAIEVWEASRAGTQVQPPG
jgi:hypothetical protein